MALLGAALYVALSPRVAVPLYNTKIFHPDKYPIGEYDLEAIGDVKLDEVWFNSLNGKRLHGWFFQVPGARKTLLYHHGNAGNLTHRVPALKCLFQAGVSVFLYDYQGFGRSDGEPTLQSICEDGVAAFDYLHNIEGIPCSDIVIYGESLGSGVACQVAAVRPSAGLILQSGFSSLRRIGCEVLPWCNIYPNWLMPQPEMDNASIISREHVPLLIMHGQQDIVIPFAHGEELYRLATEPKIFVPLERAGHSDIVIAEPDRYIHAIKDFIDTLNWHGPWCYYLNGQQLQLTA
jgi:uncharacterized protein